MQPTNSPLHETHENTSKAFSELKEGDIFTEKYDYIVIVAIVRKNLVVIYQGTPNNICAVCYDGPDDVRRKYSNSNQSGYWVTFVKNDKEYLEKLING